MLITIIINNFNYGRYLRSAIESALSQTCKDCEVIVVDDGSTDNSREVIDSFGGRVRALYKSNGGQASAFNAGFSASSGDLVLFLDSDDILCEHAATEVSRHWCPGLSKIQFPLQMIDDCGKSIGGFTPSRKLAEGDVLNEMLANGHYTTSPTTGNVFSRRFLDAVMPIPEDRWISHADSYLIDTAPFYGHVGAIADTLGQYRIHSSSLDSFSVQGILSLTRVRFRALLAVYREDLLLDHSSRRGLTFVPGTITNTLQNRKLRLTSAVLEAAAHPFSGDNKWQLARELLRAVWVDGSCSLRKRAAATIWVAVLLAAPYRTATRVAAYGISPGLRNASLARAVGVSGPEECPKT